MVAETVIMLVILLYSATPLIVIGIVQYRSKKPVDFWSGEKPPEKEQITDMKAYNQKHGIMWILFGAGLIFSFACGLPFGGEAAALLCIIEVAGGIAGMILYHNRLNRIYRRKTEESDPYEKIQGVRGNS